MEWEKGLIIQPFNPVILDAARWQMTDVPAANCYGDAHGDVSFLVKNLSAVNGADG